MAQGFHASRNHFHSVFMEILNTAEVSLFPADKAWKHGMRLETWVRIISMVLPRWKVVQESGNFCRGPGWLGKRAEMQRLTGCLEKIFSQAALTTSQWSAELGRVYKQHMNYSAKYVAHKDTAGLISVQGVGVHDWDCLAQWFISCARSSHTRYYSHGHLNVFMPLGGLFAYLP